MCLSSKLRSQKLEEKIEKIQQLLKLYSNTIPYNLNKNVCHHFLFLSTYEKVIDV